VSGADFREVVGAYASGSDAGLTIKLSPGSQMYFEARAFHGQPATEADLVGAVIVAAIGGHPDADEDRADTKLNVVWGHHLAIVLGEDPRRIAETYAPTETKTISRRIQDLDVSGVEVVRLGDGDPFGPGRAVSPRPA
jgi:hypothetical protein